MKSLVILVVILSVSLSFSQTLFNFARKARQIIPKENQQDQDGTRWDAIKQKYGDLDELDDKQEDNEDDVDDQQGDIEEEKDDQVDDIQEISDEFLQKRSDQIFLKRKDSSLYLSFQENDIPANTSDYDQFSVVNFDDEEFEDNSEDHKERLEDLQDDNDDYKEDQSEDVDDEISD